MYPPDANGPMSTCGTRWSVTLTDAATFVMLGPAEMVPVVAFREHTR